MKRRTDSKDLEGGTANYWGSDIDSKEDNEWAAAVRAMSPKKLRADKMLKAALKRKKK